MSASQDKQELVVSAPSNIAFVKYWGKKGQQLPINPSVSMTLQACVTKTKFTYRFENDGPALESYSFEGNENPSFKARIEKYLGSVIEVCPALKNLKFSIESENTFPHSAGIASSASAFAAIGYALAYIDDTVSNDLNMRASNLARLGSGSAARSIDGPYMAWGLSDAVEGSSDEHAVKLADIHSEFENVCDSILLVSKDEKAVSSSQGHALMQDHPFKQVRIDQARKNTKELVKALKIGDWEHFGKVVEEEALTLHAMMMTSDPSFILLAPQSLEVIKRVRDYRAQSKLPLYFTIDAGPNIHLIYPEQHAEEIQNFINAELADLCEGKSFINDKCGSGTRIINE